MCICIMESLCCTSESNTTLEISYTLPTDFSLQTEKIRQHRAFVPFRWARTFWLWQSSLTPCSPQHPVLLWYTYLADVFEFQSAKAHLSPWERCWYTCPLIYFHLQCVYDVGSLLPGQDFKHCLASHFLLYKWGLFFLPAKTFQG